MSPKKKDKIITLITVVSVTIVMIALAAIVYLCSVGSISEEAMLMGSTMLSGLMFVIVILFGAYSYSVRPKLVAQYRMENGLPPVDEKDKERP
jgi:hypothetical protein